jgi:hypothetical protein
VEVGEINCGFLNEAVKTDGDELRLYASLITSGCRASNSFMWMPKGFESKTVKIGYTDVKVCIADKQKDLLRLRWRSTTLGSTKNEI